MGGQVKIAVATYNTGRGTKVFRDLRRLRDVYGVSLIAGQEIGVSKKNLGLRLFAKTAGWGLYAPEMDGDQRPHRITYDPTVWAYAGELSLRVYDDTRVGPAGAGPSVLTGRFVECVILRHKASGRLYAFISAHLPPSVRRHDIPEVERSKREDLAKAYVTKLALSVDALAGLVDDVFVLGDFNLRRDDPLLRPLSHRLETDPSPRGTHGDHDIDLVFRPDGYDEITVDVGDGFTSDHRPKVWKGHLTVSSEDFK